jgi:hypothetical protein
MVGPTGDHKAIVSGAFKVDPPGAADIGFAEYAGLRRQGSDVVATGRRHSRSGEWPGEGDEHIVRAQGIDLGPDFGIQNFGGHPDSADVLAKSGFVQILGLDPAAGQIHPQEPPMISEHTTASLSTAIFWKGP